MGEVHTGLLQNSSAMAPEVTTQLLEVVMGQTIRRGARPIAYAISPDVSTGLDCPLPSSNGARPRVVGTAICRTVITAGHVVQSHCRTRIVAGDTDQRQLWSHYLAQPGVLEVLGKKINTGAVIEGFLNGGNGSETLDLGAIARRALDVVQLSEKLDHRVPFKAARTILKWAADDSGATTDLTFTIRADSVRTVSLPSGLCNVDDVTDWCEDLALHDWLLATLLAIVERSRIGTGSRTDVVRRLAPAIDYLMHLWMPAARTGQSMQELWDGLERQPGFTRQWKANVARIRDQLALASISALPYSTKV